MEADLNDSLQSVEDV